jgi:hypothetical protein
MTTSTEQVRIYSEHGAEDCNNELLASMDGTKPSCPITLYCDGQPVFSLGSEEIDDFCAVLQQLAP